MLLHFSGANSQLDRIQQLRDSSGLIRCGTTRIRIRYGLEPGGPGRYGCAYGMATGAVLKRAPLARRGSFGLTTPGLQSARPRTGGAGGWRWDARGHTVGLGPPGPRGCAHCARRAGAVSRHKAGEKPRRAWSKSQNSGPPGRAGNGPADGRLARLSDKCWSLRRRFPSRCSQTAPSSGRDWASMRSRRLATLRARPRRRCKIARPLTARERHRRQRAARVTACAHASAKRKGGGGA